MYAGPLAVLVALIFAGWARSTVPHVHLIWMVDFGSYRSGAAAILHGRSLYDARANAGPVPNLLPFDYTPFAGLLLTPTALGPAWFEETLWTVGNVLALAAALWLSLGSVSKLSRRQRCLLVPSLTVAAHVLDPILLNTVNGQINCFLMLLVMIDFSPLMKDRHRGIAVGLCAGIKLTPLIFVIYLLCTGRRRAALQASAVFLATIAAGFLIEPYDSRRYWFGGIVFDSKRILMGPLGVNHSLSGLFARLNGSVTPPAGFILVSALVGVLGMAAAVQAHRQHDDLRGLLLVAFTAILISPVTWPPHMVWVAPALVWLWFARWRVASPLPKILFFGYVLWFEVPLYWLAQRFDGALAYQVTPAGALLATLGSPITPILLSFITLPYWTRRLAPRGGPVPAEGQAPGLSAGTTRAPA